jgi:hypothetical protein
MIAIPQELTSGTCARMERRRRNVMGVIAHCFPRCDRTDHLCRSSSVLPDSVLLVLTLGLFYWAQFKFDWRLLFHLCARFGHGSRLNERQFYLPPYSPPTPFGADRYLDHKFDLHRCPEDEGDVRRLWPTSILIQHGSRLGIFGGILTLPASSGTFGRGGRWNVRPIPLPTALLAERFRFSSLKIGV